MLYSTIFIPLILQFFNYNVFVCQSGLGVPFRLLINFFLSEF